MKRLIAIAALCLSTTAAFAAEITLSPGMSAHIRPSEVTLVSCGGTESSALPLCSITRNQNGSYYEVRVGENLFESFYELPRAVTFRDQLRTSGICR